MRSLLPWLLWLSCLATAIAETELPPVPSDGVYDDARLLDDTARQRLVEVIKELKTKSDVRLYIAAYTLLPGDLNEHARRLRREWAPGSRGMVMVYRRGSQQLAFSSNEDDTKFIPLAKLYEICNEAVAAALTHEEPRQRILAAVNTLSREIQNDLRSRDEQRSGMSSQVLKLLGGLVLALLVIIGLGYAAVSRLSQRREEQETKIRFPEVIVGTRLGASYGGGTVSEMEFEKAAASRGDGLGQRAN